jgi:hypothetical protein
MVNVHIDPSFTDEERRRRVYLGDIIVYTNVPEVAKFARFTREVITSAMAPDEPTTVHSRRAPAKLADLLITLKPWFIHHPDSIAHVRRIATALGSLPEDTFADVPKLRTAFPSGGLSTGIAYAFQAHRDTWYAAPPQQVNWWMPIWPARSDNVMEFYPRWFDRARENNSSNYNYYVANEWRGRIRDFSGNKDTRVHPAAVVPIDEDETRLCLVPPVGGIMLFSGDHLHASIPNTSPLTRYSVDFRTVHIADVRDGIGAPRVDARSAGTSLRDFRRLTDLTDVDEADVKPYETEGPDTHAIKVFVPRQREVPQPHI